MYITVTFGSILDEEENAFFCSDTNRDNDEDNDKDKNEDEDKGEYVDSNRDIIEDLDRYEFHSCINNFKRVLFCHVSNFSSKSNVFLSIFKYIICSLYLIT